MEKVCPPNLQWPLYVHRLEFGICRILQATLISEQVYLDITILDITIDKYSSLFLASGALAVIMSLRMTFMRYETKLADYSPLLFRNCGIADFTVEYQYATHRYQLFLQHMGQWATVLDHREDLYVPELRLVIGWSQRIWTLSLVGCFGQDNYSFWYTVAIVFYARF